MTDDDLEVWWNGSIGVGDGDLLIAASAGPRTAPVNATPAPSRRSGLRVGRAVGATRAIAAMLAVTPSTISGLCEVTGYRKVTVAHVIERLRRRGELTIVGRERTAGRPASRYGLSNA